MLHLKQIILAFFILNITIQNTQSQILDVLKIAKKVLDASCHNVCNSMNYFKNYCCLEGVLTDLEPCCNMFTFIFNDGFDQKNFEYAIKNPRPLNIALVISIFLICIGLFGSVYGCCCKRRAKTEYVFMNQYPSPTSNSNGVNYRA